MKKITQPENTDMPKSKGDIVKTILRIYINRELPAGTKDAVQKWIVGSFHEDEKNAALEDVWDNIQPDPKLASKKKLDELHRLLAIEPGRPSLRMRVGRVAAIVIPLLVLAGMLFWQLDRTGSDTHRHIRTAAITHSDTLKINRTEADGSEIWMNSQSSIVHESPRRKALEGEAFFKVSRQGQFESFVVATEHLEITVTGTEFNVQAYKNSQTTIITLYTGSLEVRFGGQMCSIVGGEELTYYNEDGYYVVKSISRTRPEWMRDIINFSDQPVQSIFKALENIYGVRFVGTHRIGDENMRLKFEGDIDLDEVMFFMSNISGKFTYRIVGDRVILTPKPQEEIIENI